jgi:CheY-like chemotaxis protein
MAAILIAEDEPFVRMMAEDAAERLGLEPLSVTDGDAAIAVARAVRRLAILFTDINMPPGPDGWTVARAVREIHPDIRVIYTSGQAKPEDCANTACRSPGCCRNPIPLTNWQPRSPKPAATRHR